MAPPSPHKISFFADRIFREDQLRTLDIDALKGLLRPNLSGYTVSANSLPVGTLLYRGVRTSELPQRQSQVGYPPPGIARLGRANRVGEPMFYCSRGEPAILFEMRARAGDTIALSAWSVTAAIWMHHLGYHRKALKNLGTTSRGPRQQLADPIPNETRRNARLRRLLSTAFTEHVRESIEYRYKLTVAINELLLELPLTPDWRGPSFAEAAGTAYPSLQMKGEVDNAVILPRFVDAALRLQAVQMLSVEAADADALHYTVRVTHLSREIARDDRIVWLDSLPSEMPTRLHFALEGDTWVMRDDTGTVFEFRGHDDGSRPHST